MAVDAAYGAIAAIAIFLLTVWLYRSYASPGCTWVGAITITISWSLALSLCILLPLDFTPEADKTQLRRAWDGIYWSSYLLTWLLIPLLQGYVEAGDFTFKGKLKSSIRSNLIFYGVAGALLVAFLIYVAIEQELGWSQLLGFAVCLGNTYGLTVATLLLGYGMVEIPRRLWHYGNRVVRLKYAQYTIAQNFDDIEVLRDELEQTQLLLQKLSPKIPPNHSLRPHFEQIESLIPNEDEVELGEFSEAKGIAALFAGLEKRPVRGTLNRPDKLKIVEELEDKELTLPDLVKLHYHVKSLVRTLGVMDAQWRDTVEEAIHLEELLTRQKAPQAAPKWSDGLREAFMWRFETFWEPQLLRGLAVICALLSAVLVWSEATLLSPVDLSPVSRLIEAARGNSSAVQFFSLLMLGYLAFCAFWALWRVRLLQYYQMHAKRRTDENSLLFNASFMLRLAMPLGANFLDIAKPKDHTAFGEVVGKMDVIPFFGSTFKNFLPILISLFCAATLFNVYGRLLKCLHITRFEYHENYDDDMLEQGKMLLKKEKRKRGIRVDQPLL